MAKTVTFSVTTMPRKGAQGSFRDTVLNLRTDQLEDCFLSVFHISDSYALLTGEALPGAHTATNAELRTYLTHRLAGHDSLLDFDVKIDRASEPARSRS
ncbi:hypothetical protein [Arthrobacter pascens]|jgi:hypothetical protein|uniref:hypothetical protein n=1 Tax=Arthrobacter pascens TaxID=1677 RepID=UPI00196AF810|nr:hypothetical protein [Arthrobacter pascens]MBN3496793.1 hypothetical protein [Arthrobacter pascens]